MLALHLSPHVSEAEFGPDHSMHMLKLACAKILGMLSSTEHSVSAHTDDTSHWHAICDELPEVFEPPSGFPSERDIEQKTTMLELMQ